jgi:hypothetical protein
VSEELCNCDCSDTCPLGKTGMYYRCSLEERDAALRAWEHYLEAYHMAIDLNQPAYMRDAWVQARDQRHAFYLEKVAVLIILWNRNLPGIKENVAAPSGSGKPSAGLLL